MALGKTLQEARLQRKLTTSQVAAATRMKVQMVESLEREDFSKVMAPIYGKGFLRLYAEHVGLDPRPLIEEFMAFYAPHNRPSLQSEEPPPARAAGAPLPPGFSHVEEPPASGLFDEVEKAQGGEEPQISSSLHEAVRSGAELVEGGPDTPARDRWPQGEESETPAGDGRFENRSMYAVLKVASIAIGILLILVFVGSALSRWMAKSPDAQGAPNSTSVAAKGDQPDAPVREDAGAAPAEPSTMKPAAGDPVIPAPTMTHREPADSGPKPKPSTPKSGKLQLAIDPSAPYVD